MHVLVVFHLAGLSYQACYGILLPIRTDHTDVALRLLVELWRAEHFALLIGIVIAFYMRVVVLSGGAAVPTLGLFRVRSFTTWLVLSHSCNVLL